MRRGRPLSSLGLDAAPPWRDPPEWPDYWIEKVRTVTDTEGVEWVVLVNQDGDEFLLDEVEWRQRRT